jgi:hypothetical protein
LPVSTPTAGARPAPSPTRGEDGSDLASTIILALGIGSFLLAAAAQLTPRARRRRGAAALDESGHATNGGSRPTDAPAWRPRVQRQRHGPRPASSGLWGPRTDRFERSAAPPAAGPAAHTPPERVAPAQPASAAAPAKRATGKKRAARSPSKKAPARTAAVPVRCEIICRQNSSRSRFEAIGFTADDRPAWLAESAGFRVGTGRQVERSPAALTAHERLVEHLTRRGWQPDGNGEAWYEARFRRRNADA